jgi:hypothetical protein
MITDTCPLIILDSNRRSQSLDTVSIEYSLKDAFRAMAVTLVSHPVPPLTQLNALNIQMVSLGLDTLWRHVGRLYGPLSLEGKLIEQWERSLVSALPI